MVILLNLLRNCQIVFHRDAPFYIATSNAWDFQISTSSVALVISFVVVVMANLLSVNCYLSHCGFDLVFP